MTRLTVEIDDLVAAAGTMHDEVGEPVRRAAAQLVDVLDTCGSMAGDDEGGRSWATTYDDAAESVVVATNRVAAAAFQTATLFGRSASNYARAEAASTTSGPGHRHTSCRDSRRPGRWAALLRRRPQRVEVVTSQAAGA